MFVVSLSFNHLFLEAMLDTVINQLSTLTDLIFCTQLLKFSTAGTRKMETIQYLGFVQVMCYVQDDLPVTWYAQLEHSLMQLR